MSIPHQKLKSAVRSPHLQSSWLNGVAFRRHHEP
ncbi:Protein of unknown function [Pyronema omphalodes CBS 100304]|uniref:Uncharacterized protein n=1 Tax=Pyronema omphalodes (strain CBS 100304) TaxID=1076935 RepID=U4L291_PYROM|nr:Protein of unknown function [Pyronema omphalodes CBS 100304]